MSNKKNKTEKKIPKTIGTGSFISFASVSGGSNMINDEDSKTPAVSSAALLPVYTGSDVEFSVTAKKLLKKDSITRMKALSEMRSILEVRGASVAQDIIPYFVYVYTRLITENQQNVREALIKNLISLLEIDKRSFQPYMQNLIGAWWVSMSDPSADVAKAARHAFEVAIPPKKRETVLVYLSPQILRYIQENLSMTRDAASFGDKSILPDELEERHERIVLSSIDAIGRLLSVLTPAGVASISSPVSLVPSSPLSEPGTASNESQHLDIPMKLSAVCSDVLWKHGSSSKASIRKVVFDLIGLLCTNAPEALTPSAQLHVIQMNIDALSDSEPRVLQSVVASFVSVSRAFPSVWTSINIKKAVLPKLRDQIKRDPSLILPCLLPLMGSLPPAVGSIAGTAGEPFYHLLVEVSHLTHSATSSTGGSACPPETVWLTVAEGCTLLLLRPWPIEGQEKGNPKLVERAQLLCKLLVESLSILIRGFPTTSALMSQVQSQTCKLLVQIHRATLACRDVSGERWQEWVWSVLSSEICRSIASIQLPLTSSTFGGSQLAESLEEAINSGFRVVQVVLEGIMLVDKLERESDSSSRVPTNTSQALGISGVLATVLMWLIRRHTETMKDDEGLIDGAWSELDVIQSTIWLTLFSRVLRQLPVTMLWPFFTNQLKLSKIVDLLLSVWVMRIMQFPKSTSDIALTKFGDHFRSMVCSDSNAALITVIYRCLEEVFECVSYVRSFFGFQLIDMPDAIIGMHTGDPYESIDSLCDGFRKAQRRLVRYCMDTGSLVGVSIALESGILDKLGQEITTNEGGTSITDWFSDAEGSWLQSVLLASLGINKSTTDSGDIIDAAVSSALARTDSSDRRKFVLSCTRSTWVCEQLDVLQMSFDAWERTRSRSGLWAVLSLVARNSRSKPSLDGTLTADVLVSMIEAAFFGRLREARMADLKLSKRHRKPTVGQVSSSDGTIECWSDVISNLLPTLDRALVEKVVKRLAQRLRELLRLGMSSALSGTTLDEDMNDNEESIPVDTTMGARKWARHAVGLLAFVREPLLSVHESVVSDMLGLESKSLWDSETSIERTDKQVNHGYLVDVVLEMVSSSGSLLSFLPIHKNPLLCLSVFRSLQMTINAGGDQDRDRTQATALWALCMSNIISPDEKNNYTSDALSIDNTVGYLAEIALVATSTEKWDVVSVQVFAAMIRATACDCSNMKYIWGNQGWTNRKFARTDDQGRLHFDFLVSRDVVDHYVAVSNGNDPNAGSGDDNQSKETSSLPCLQYVRILREGVDVDSYSLRGCVLRSTEWAADDITSTVVLSGDSEPVVVRGSRLFLGPVSASFEDRVIHMAVDAAEFEASNVALEKEVGLHFGWKEFLRWQLCSWRIVFSRLCSGVYEDVMEGGVLDLLCICFTFTTEFKFADVPVLLDSLNRLVSSCRGIVLALVKKDPVGQPIAFRAGLKVMNSLINRVGLGSGLWLGEIFIAFKTGQEAIKTKAKLCLGPDDGCEVLTSFLTVHSNLLEAADSVFLYQTSTNLLKIAMSMYENWSLGRKAMKSSNEVNFEGSILQLLRVVWRRQREMSTCLNTFSAPTSAASAALQRSETWTVAGLNFAVLSLVEGLGRECRTGVLSTAVWAIHEALLGLSRTAGRNLVSPSCVGDMEEELLQIVLDSRTVFSVRLISAKLLDVLYASASDGASGVSSVAEDRNDDSDGDALNEVLGPALCSWLWNTFGAVNNSGAGTKMDSELRSGSSDDVIRDTAAEEDKCDDDCEDVEVHEADGEDNTEDVATRCSIPINDEDNEMCRIVIAWLLCLQRISAGGVLRKTRCVEALRLSGVYMDPEGFHGGQPDPIKGFEAGKSRGPLISSRLGAYGIFRTVLELPALTRQWWLELLRGPKNMVRQFVEGSVNSYLIGREVGLAVSVSRSGGWNNSVDAVGELTVRASAVTREVVAIYVQEDARLEMKIRLPASYPLLHAEVECSSKLGFAEGRGDRWRLQIIHRLSNENGSVVDAVQLWKANVDQELRGVEPCPICYSTLHPRLLSLPSLSCRTCKNKFHSSCLYKWFQTSGKSKCVICQEPFFQ